MPRASSDETDRSTSTADGLHEVPIRTFAEDLVAMVSAWNTIEAAAHQQFPLASDEEIYQRTAGAFRYALGWSPAP